MDVNFISRYRSNHISFIDPTDNDFIEILKEPLLKSIKQQISDELIESELADYEKRLKAIIIPMVEKVTFDTIEHVRNYTDVRDEFRLRVKWRE